VIGLFDSLLDELTKFWKKPHAARSKRAFRCDCGRPVFFRNSKCLGCEAPLGYEPMLGELRVLKAGGEPDIWLLSGDKPAQGEYRRCANFDSAAGCNWLVPVDDSSTLCVACRLNRTLPDLNDSDNQRYWRSIEGAKRRLVSQLLALELPVESRTENPEQGLAFDLLRSPPDGPPVLTGHDRGLITLNIEEADDARREQVRNALGEPYRTLLGHFRHEIGHYYWDRLVWNTAWLEPFRELFGDERADYAEALKANYEHGPPPDWADRHISTYASSHPWEDWAETWAHYLHAVDSLDTAIAHGLDAQDLEFGIEPFTRDDLYDPDDPNADRMLLFLNSWLEMITVLNEMARSLGQPDFYPFVMPRAVVKKLHFVNLVVTGAKS
jgi:hypothetical protein